MERGSYDGTQLGWHSGKVHRKGTLASIKAVFLMAIDVVGWWLPAIKSKSQDSANE